MESLHIVRRWVPTSIARIAVCAAIVGAWWLHATWVAPIEGRAYVPRYSDPQTGADLMLAWGDGQAYAHYAEHGPRDTTPGAYMATRPLLPLLARMAGGPFWGLVVVSVLAAASVTRWWLLPLLAVTLRALGPEPLGLALVVVGLRHQPLRLPLFALAGLARETYLLVPLVMGIRDRALWLAAVPWAVWVSLIWRVAGSPFSGGADLGLLHPPKDWPSIVAVAASLSVGLVRVRRPLVAPFLVLAMLLPGQTLASWKDSLRVLLPLWFFAFEPDATGGVGPRGRTGDDRVRQRAVDVRLDPASR